MVHGTAASISSVDFCGLAYRWYTVRNEFRFVYERELRRQPGTVARRVALARSYSGAAFLQRSPGTAYTAHWFAFLTVREVEGTQKKVPRARN